MIGLQRLAMVFHNLLMGAETGSAQATHAHGDEIFGDIFGANMIHVDKAQQDFKVRSNFVTGVENAVLLIHTALAIKTGVSGHKSQSHQRWSETFGGIEPHHQREVIGVDIMYIAVSSINIIPRKRVCHCGEAIIGSEEIIRIQKTNHIARGHADSLVHRVIDPIVLFAFPSHAPLKLWLVGADDINGAIGAAAVNHQIFYVLECLAQDAAKCVLYRGGAVVCGGYEGDLHQSEEGNKKLLLLALGGGSPVKPMLHSPPHHYIQHKDEIYLQPGINMQVGHSERNIQYNKQQIQHQDSHQCAGG